MRSAVLAAIIATLLVSPASAQLDVPPAEGLLDRLSVEVFGGYSPAATHWTWADLDWTFTTESTRHRLETLQDGAALAGIGARYDIGPWFRVTGLLAYAPRDDRSINLHSSSRVSFTVEERNHLHWETAGGGTTVARIGLETPPVRSDRFDIWVGGGAGLVRATSGSGDEVPEQFHEVPSQFVSTWTAPSAFATARIEAPLTGSISVALAADHHWTWRDAENLEGGVREFFEAIDLGFSDVNSDGIMAKTWLFRLGLTHDLK